jgi:hypothetical protein
VGLTGEAGKRFAPRIFRITFPPASRWHGLEARVTDAPAEALVNLLLAAPLAGEVAAGVPSAVTQAHRVAVELLTREFAPLIDEWNADDANGNPVHPDEAGLRGREFAMVWAVFRAWRDGRGEDPEPDEDDGEEPDLASIPMTPVPPVPPG